VIDAQAEVEPEGDMEEPDEAQCPLDDTALLAIVADERKRSVGFDHDAELKANRELALNYAKGDMSDIPALPNRSRAVATPVADAVETILPDLAEIFLGGDDVVSFLPTGQEDEEAAEQETDYIKHVLFQKNPGFLNLISMFRDALLLKVGVAAFWWEDGKKPVPEVFEGKTAIELQMAQQAGDVSDVSQSDETGATGEPLYDFTVTERQYGCAKWMAVPAEDFTVSADTVRLEDAPYSGMRSRPRLFELIAQGHPRDKVEALPAYGTLTDDTIQQARDQAGEHDNGQNVGGKGDYRQVEIVTHLIRVLNDQDELKLWKVVTGGTETVLLSKEKLNRIGFAAITPYLEPHRFYGRSVFDLLGEIQRIQTALTRMALDSGYFALNQRHEVSETGHEHQHALGPAGQPPWPAGAREDHGGRRAPGLARPVVRCVRGAGILLDQGRGAVRHRPQRAGAEPRHAARHGQGRRRADGCGSEAGPHDRACVRRDGIKDLYLGVHALVRENATEQDVARLRGKWVPIDPTSWGSSAPTW
jgi:hypothetical protein